MMKKEKFENDLRIIKGVRERRGIRSKVNT